MTVAEAATAADGMRLAVDFVPDVIVLDLKLPDGNGLDLLSALMSRVPDLKIIVFSMYDDPAFAARALEAGARGYMTKNDDPDALLQGIERVNAGGTFLTPSMAEKLALMVTCPVDSPFRDLSSRERQVLQLLSSGLTVTEIGDKLNIAYRTAAHITAQIKTKLRVASTAALIKWAVEHPQAVA
jgi:two-component system, NarL family, invasion response regulator UvrY